MISWFEATIDAQLRQFYVVTTATIEVKKCLNRGGIVILSILCDPVRYMCQMSVLILRDVFPMSEEVAGGRRSMFKEAHFWRLKK